MGHRYPAIEFGALYQRRCRIERTLKHIMHRLHLGVVTGLTQLALQQDLAARIVADNLPRSAHRHPTSRRRALDHAGQPPQPHLLDRRALLALLRGSARMDALIHHTERHRVPPLLHAPCRNYPRPLRTKPHTHSIYQAVQLIVRAPNSEHWSHSANACMTSLATTAVKRSLAVARGHAALLCGAGEDGTVVEVVSLHSCAT